ncbi:MAG: N-6 DNA methylase [Sulfurimonas sp.]|uniref:N-6 DNA methylase n=1 Tax=Sulfurimonas sp. TaxID=2022749 RepID=UPI00260FA5F1|nr:N-6 DNA methylase [Sulfurimonas sp.]MDD5399562.1 N-6 DNA methylase [Sulfurimonas sp.]
MNEKQFTVLLRELKGGLKVEHFAKFIYLLIAWKKLSPQIKKEELTFEYFYNQKIETKKFQSVVKDLSKSIKLFELFLNQNIRIDKIESNELIKLCGIANEELAVPNVFDIFYSILDGYMDFSVANQIANFGVKLLDGNCDTIYSPFSNGYNIAYSTDKKIVAESFANEYVIELMKIIDGIDIEFTFTDPLENPTYINPNAPHLLEQFNCILSFPPMGLSTNNDFLHTDKFNRFKFHKVKSNREVAHFEHILSQTSGKAVVLMPVGFTYRGNQDEEFRKYLVENNLLEAVIQLPPNLHNATSIETTFIIIDRHKKNNDIYFLNLKHESFLQREGRKLVLNDVDNIVSIYENKQEIESISRFVTSDEISNNSYSFAIDRYIISRGIAEVQKKLQSFELINLEDIADIRRSQLFKDEGEGKEVYEVSPSDFNKAGFLLECGKIKQIGSQYKRLQTYKLEPYDVLLSTKGTIGKVAIVGEISETIIASQAVQVIRLKAADKKEKAIALYMFLKSNLGQTILSTLVSGVAMPQIATAEIKKLSIPILTKEQEKQTVLNFNSEIKMYNEINKIYTDVQSIHDSFLGAK